MSIECDAIVVGLGPAGATAAYELARSGQKVLAFDKEKFPRYKPCGGAVSAKVNRILKFDFSGVVEDVVDTAIFTYRSKRNLFIQNDTPIASMVMRDRFDNLLVDMAKKAGAVVMEGIRVSGFKEDISCIYVETDRGKFRARVLIAADGASSFVWRTLYGTDLGADLRETVLTIESEMSADRNSLEKLRNKIIIDFGCIPWGYAWIFPKKEYLSVGIAGVKSRLDRGIKEYFNDFLKCYHDILKGGEVRNQKGWIIPEFNSNTKRIAGRRILLVGDAGHIVDPFTGEGIYYAVRSAQLAARAVVDGIGKDDFSAYETDLEKELYAELSAAQKLADMVYSNPKVWYSLVEAEPGLIKKYLDVITGNSSYREFVQEIKSYPRFKLLFNVVKGWLKGLMGR